jgi:hypothetical protein
MKNVSGKYIKIGVNSRHTLSNYHVALMKIYWAFVEGGNLSVTNSNKQQPIGWNVNNICLLQISQDTKGKRVQ